MLSLIDIERSNDRAVSKPNWHFGTLYLLIIVSLWAYFAITLLHHSDEQKNGSGNDNLSPAYR
jgi:hypothetical protein